jgi:serine acetyltransferase
MSLASRLLLWFPALHLAAALVAAAWFVVAPGWLAALALPAAVYGLPLVAWRVHQRAAPLREGVSRLVSGPYSPWWGSHQLQWWFIAAPALEEALRAVPGLFSLWLRAWGADVGAGVYWAPGLMLADRPLLTVGDRAVFGHGVQISAHIIKPTDEGRDLLCVVRRVRIGERAFLGAACRLGPGVVVGPGVLVAAGSDHLGRAAPR